MKNIYKVEELKEMLVKEDYTDNYNRHIIYVDIISVARSGLSRQMKFYLKNKHTDEVFNITEAVAELLGYNLTNKYAIRIKGVGMDMRWHTVYRMILRAGIADSKTFYYCSYDVKDFKSI